MTEEEIENQHETGQSEQSSEPKKPRIGVFICHCGHNIADTVAVEKVTEFAKTLPNVEHAEHYMFMCSKPGIELIKKAIKEKNLDRTVVASCSKTQHGPTFAHAIEEEGLNRHMHQQVNIREWCSWPHIKDKAGATEKAEQMLEAGVNRSRKLEPVETRQIATTPAALVIGAGIAGLRAASDLAALGVKTYVVEKEPTIGGHMTQLNKTFPTQECPQCSISPLTNGVANDKNITLLTMAQVKAVEGSFGNFKVEVEITPRYVKDNCTSCGDCSAHCPVEVPSEWDSGMSMRKAIYKPFPQAIPATYVRDKKACIECHACENVCPAHAVDFSQKRETRKVEVGTIILAVGYDEYDPTEISAYHYHQDGYEDIITQLELERMLVAGSITNSALLRPSDGKVPRRVTMIQCVGSRNEQVGNKYCTGVCCMFAIKNAQIVKDNYPDTDVAICYIDIRTPGLNNEEFYKKAQEKGIKFIRGRPGEIQRDPITGQLLVIVEDTLSQTPLKIKSDLVVLSAAMVPPRSIGTLGSALHVLRDKTGFVKEFHIKMNPVKSSKDGIFLAGAIQGPKDIPQSVAQAGAAASLAAAPLVRGYIEKEMLVPQIDYDLCVNCGLCISACSPAAIYRNEAENKIMINEISCKACGLCGPACPTGAIQLKNFRDDEISDEIAALAVAPREGGHVHD
ncbi:MAG TPA: CoB--CoM heterodisulfide reductase iron-sulfur subunit A family protein [Candidatus Lokiarchaeia archaeon]|nr:CoB--CoM heterodisulfide reductase iron-sulfur subunit A family protein [Candidatus Lokiarchaeia archaeon]